VGVAAGVAVPISIIAAIGIAALVLFLVYRFRRHVRPPPAALRRGSQRLPDSTPLHDNIALQHVNSMYSPQATGFRADL
jgi:membrane protein implicated in regulation of membrane protease activity